MAKLVLRLLQAVGVIVAYLACPSHAQGIPPGYPAKPLRMLLGVSPGSGLDQITRVVSMKLAERWGRPVIVDNRVGGSGAIALEVIGRGAPDGYTFYSGATQIIGAWPLRQISFDPRKALAPVVQMYSSTYILVVNPSLPVRSMQELIAVAKSRPGALNYGSSGVGSAGHLSMEILNARAGMKMVHVPYKGVAISMLDLMSGQIQVLLSSVVSILPHVKSGRVRAVAVAQLKRSRVLPVLPTMEESGIPALRGFEMGVFGGIYAPAGVSPAIQAKLHRDVSEIVQLPEVKEPYEASGGEIAPAHTIAQFRDKVRRQITELDDFIRTSGIKVTRD